MSIYGSALTDEELAFLLQQEEFGATEIRHIILPPVAHPSAAFPPIKASNLIEHHEVIDLDGYSSDEVIHVGTKTTKKHTVEEDMLGVLDMHELFVKYNEQYFEGRLGAVTVEWSPRMTLCAGLCSWNRSGECRIKLSSKLLQYRSNKELKETLLVCNFSLLIKAHELRFQTDKTLAFFLARVHPRLSLRYQQQQGYVLTNPNFWLLFPMI
jgi:hypothetical protein